MTDAEWPKPGDVVAVRVEFAERLEGRRDGRPATYFIVFPRSREWPPIAVERERVAPWRSAEEVRTAEAVIEAARFEQCPVPGVCKICTALAAYDRARKEAAQ